MPELFREPVLTGNNRDNKGRFNPGTSGNPSGRPEGSISIASMIRQKLETKPKGQKETYAGLIVEQILSRAIKGDYKMIKHVLEYIDGRPKQLDKDEEIPLLILDDCPRCSSLDDSIKKAYGGKENQAAQ